MKVKLIVITLFISGILFYYGCNTTQRNQPLAATQPKKADSVFTPLGIEYIPPLPAIPGQFIHVVTLDKREAYLVHATACDRATLVGLFPAEAKFYLLNTTFTWFWGDGTSSREAAIDHRYARAGTYTIRCDAVLSFRGGYTCRIISENINVVVPEPLTDPVLVVSPIPAISCTSGGPPTTSTFTMTNSGGRPVIVKPIIVKMSGTIDDLSWLSVTPAEVLVKNDNVPVTFTLFMDCTHAPTGSLQIDIQFAKDLITRGWYLNFVSSSISPPM